MGKLILRDGSILDLTREQSEKLSLVILMASDLNKQVKVDSHSFRLTDIVTDPEEVQRIMQQKMFDVPAIHKPRKNARQLA